jgi:hypothetical protein
MTNFKYKKTVFISLGAILLLGLATFGFINDRNGPPGQMPTEVNQTENLRAFVDIANKSSGIQSGTAFNYVQVGVGNQTNFGIVRCMNEVRCDNVVQKQVVKFEQSNQLSPDTAEADASTDTVVSLHRAVPTFVGDEYTPEQIEKTARDFLEQVYPEFKTIEPTLTFAPGMKGARLNNGNYFFRWNDEQFKLPDGLSTDVPPFVQVGITASGFIFSYDNTIPLYRSALAELQ